MQGNLASSVQAFNRQIETLLTPDLIGDAPSFGATPFEPTSLADASGTIGDDTDDANLVVPPGSILRDRAGTLRVVLPASRKAGRRLRAARRRDSSSRGGWTHIKTYTNAAAALAANDVVWPAALSLGEGVRHGAPVIAVGGQPVSLTAGNGDVGTSFHMRIGEGDNVCDMGVQHDLETLVRFTNQTLILCGPHGVRGWVRSVGQKPVDLEARIDDTKLSAALHTIHDSDLALDALNQMRTATPDASFMDVGNFVAASCGANIGTGVARALCAVVEPMEGAEGEAQLARGKTVLTVVSNALLSAPALIAEVAHGASPHERGADILRICNEHWPALPSRSPSPTPPPGRRSPAAQLAATPDVGALSDRSDSEEDGEGTLMSPWEGIAAVPPPRMLPPPAPALVGRRHPPPPDQSPRLPPRGAAGGPHAEPRGSNRNEGFLGLVPARLMHKNDEEKLGLIAAELGVSIDVTADMFRGAARVPTCATASAWDGIPSLRAAQAAENWAVARARCLPQLAHLEGAPASWNTLHDTLNDVRSIISTDTGELVDPEFEPNSPLALSSSKVRCARRNEPQFKGATPAVVIDKLAHADITRAVMRTAWKEEDHVVFARQLIDNYKGPAWAFIFGNGWACGRAVFDAKIAKQFVNARDWLETYLEQWIIEHSVGRSISLTAHSEGARAKVLEGILRGLFDLDSIVTVFGGRRPKDGAAQTSRRLIGPSHEAGRLGRPTNEADIGRAMGVLDVVLLHIHGDAGGADSCTSPGFEDLWDKANLSWPMGEDRTDSARQMLRLALSNLQFEIFEKRKTGSDGALDLTAATAQVFDAEMAAMEEQQHLRAARQAIMGSTSADGGGWSGVRANNGGPRTSGTAPLGTKRERLEEGALGGEHSKRHRGGRGAERPAASSDYGRAPPPPPILHKISKDPNTPSAIGALEAAMRQRFKHLSHAEMPCPWDALFGCTQSQKCARCQAQRNRDKPIIVPPEMVAKVKNACSEELQRQMAH